MPAFIYLILGGMAGTVCRYLLSGGVHRFLGYHFPYGTFIVNMLGCVILGILYTASQGKLADSPQLRLLLMTGFCGAFTTFSTFMLETVELVKSGHTLQAGGNILLSIVVGLMAIRVGIILGNMI